MNFVKSNSGVCSKLSETDKLIYVTMTEKMGPNKPMYIEVVQNEQI